MLNNVATQSPSAFGAKDGPLPYFRRFPKYSDQMLTYMEGVMSRRLIRKILIALPLALFALVGIYA